MSHEMETTTADIYCAMAINATGDPIVIRFGESARGALDDVYEAINEMEPSTETLYRLVAFDMQHPAVVREAYDVTGRGCVFVQAGAEPVK